MQNNFHITDKAVKKITSLINSDGKSNMNFRVSVLGGGCSGFQYKYDLDPTVNKNDVVIKKGNVQIIIDDLSIGFLENSKLDFIENLGSAAFEISNPNATAKCGCGNSFSV